VPRVRCCVDRCNVGRVPFVDIAAVQAVPTDDERAQAFDTLLNEHNALKTKLNNIQEENRLIRDKLKSSDEDRLALENVIDNFRQNALKDKESTKKLYDDLLAAREQDSIELSRLKHTELLYSQTLADNADLRQLLEKEHQLMTLTQSLTEKNSVLRSDYEQMRTAFEQMSAECQRTTAINDEQTQRLTRYEDERRTWTTQIEQAEEKYQTLQRSYGDILKQNDDCRVEIVALKKKHQANTKDLIKQLQQLQKAKSSHHEDGASLAVLHRQVE
jgi:chromosome segregation ATPase